MESNMIKIGMMIGDRYEILEKIGTGGMSDVYKAKCHKLNRFVAVKVLKQEFSENSNFVSKFTIEAQAAAGLMHPNIVNVYDVGEDGGIHYIVMELVEGITLKKYIEKKARLSYKEAVSIAIQVSMGIESAHHNHIIHRDIKPQNIIISKDGKVKVTDFGIAKAATSNTITSNVMGSVHYTSPEQARGGYSDEKSDIYSLGITLFEMLTGRVPFNGETTVAIAIKHIQEELPSPKEFVPEIPASVEGIVVKCCKKSPDRRYQCIEDVIVDLKQSLMNPHEDFVVQTDMDADSSTRVLTNDMAQIKRQAVSYEYMEPEVEEPMRLRRDTEEFYESDMEDGLEEEEYYDYDPKVERITTVLAIGAGVIICIIIIFLLIKVFGLFGSGGNDNLENPIIPTEESSSTQNKDTQESSKEKMVKMIDVIGWDVEDAKKALVKIGIAPETEYKESDAYDEGVVINADVNVGDEIPLNSKVILTVSSGVESVNIPNVVGATFENASAALGDLGFIVNRAESFSNDVELGVVISQSPTSETKAPIGSTVTVTVSAGPEDNRIKVPNVIGFSEEDGTFTLIEAGINIASVSHVYHSEIAKGKICYQSYSQGSYVEPGTGMTIHISLGQEDITYKYNGFINAPTAQEAPDYVAGTEVKLTLITDNGRELLNTKTSSFPQAANFHNITAAGGTLNFTYKVTTEGTTSKDPNTGETITTPGSTEDKTFTRRVDFVKEQ